MKWRVENSGSARTAKPKTRKKPFSASNADINWKKLRKTLEYVQLVVLKTHRKPGSVLNVEKVWK